MTGQHENLFFLPLEASRTLPLEKAKKSCLKVVQIELVNSTISQIALQDLLFALEVLLRMHLSIAHRLIYLLLG
jgi:hypothetical protein